MSGIGNMIGSTVNDAFSGVTKQHQSGNSFCDNCGEALTPGAKFCDKCGASQILPDTCMKCGFKFIKLGKFCPMCGTKREDQ